MSERNTSDIARQVPPPTLHIICERDVGLFALVLSVVAHVQWALDEGRIPIVLWGKDTCYWTPHGYRGRDTVWEYYFEPVERDYPVSRIPQAVREQIERRPPDRRTSGYFLDETTFVSSHTGGHVVLGRENVKADRDPGDELRQAAQAVIARHLRPRQELQRRARAFHDERLRGEYVVGVHIRGTDALVDPRRSLRARRVNFRRYFEVVERLVRTHPNARVFVASDAQSSIDQMRERFGARVVAFESIRHESGELAGQGPTGRIMPAYLTGDRDRAARSGEEAVIEYLLLCRCDYLVHNGSGIPRMVLLTVPGMPADNTLPRQAYWRRAIANRSWLPLARVAGLWRHRAGVAFRAMANQPVARWYPVLRDLWASRGQADGAMAGDRFRS